MIDDEQGCLRLGKRYVDQIFTLKQIDAKVRKNRLYAGFMDLEKAYDRVNSESLWEMLRMYDEGNILLNGIKSMHVKFSRCHSKRW